MLNDLNRQNGISRRLFRWRYTIVSLTVLVGVVVSLAAFLKEWRDDRLRVEDAFRREAALLDDRFRDDIQNNLDDITSVADLFHAVGPVDRRQFRDVAAPLLSRHPTVLAIVWAPRVPHARRAAFEAAGRAELSPTFHIFERDAQDRTIPVGQRAEYFPVYYRESLAEPDPSRIVGQDWAAVPARLEALERARDTGAPAATARVPMLQRRSGIHVYWPIYQQGAPRGTVEERRANLIGFVGAIFWLDQMVETSVKKLGPRGINVDLFDEGARADERLLYHYPSARLGDTAPRVGAMEEGSAIRAGLHWATTLEVGGRRWSLLFHPTADFLSAHRSWGMWWVLGGGLFATALIGGYAFLLAGRSAEVERLVVNRTHELRQANEQLKDEVTERKQAEDALGERMKQLEAIRTVSTEITRELDLTPLLDLITRRAAELVGAMSGVVYLWDETAQVLIPRAWPRLGEWIGDVRLKPGEGISGTVAQRRTGMIINDYRASPYAHPLFVERTGITAVLAEPLLYRDRLVGVITINDEGSRRPFTDQDREILSLFAAQAAIAIENARLHAAVGRRAEQFATLTRVTQSLMASMDPGTVGQEIMAAVQALMPGAAARLWNVREQDEVLELIASVGLQDPLGGTVRFRLGEGLAGVAAATRAPVISRDLNQDPRFINKAWAAQEGLVSAILLPLIVGERIHGILSICTREPHDFSEAEMSLLQALAAQAAVAIENARLYGEALEKTARLEGLTRTSAKVTGTLRLEEVLEAIVEEAAKLLRVEGAGFRLREGDRLVLGSTYGLARHVMLAPSVHVGESLSGLVMEQARPVAVPDIRELERSLLQHQDAALAHGVVALLGVPVRYRDRIIGVLNVFGKERRTFSEEEIRLLGVFADHAAIAIENARLYREIQQHAATLEARVKERTAELEEALQVKSQFLANMSHELRTPLNAVLGFSEILLGREPGDLTPRQERYLQLIRRGGERLLELVTDLLEMAEAQAGRAAFQLESLPVAQFFGEILSSLALVAKAKRVEVCTTLDPELPAIVADGRKLRQVLHHLVSNAIRHTPAEGRITVSVGRVSAPEGERVEITVGDTGVGIRPEDLERIFRPFEQADSSDSRQYGGAGLGLALVQRLVELHGGRVWAESEGEGRGARFIVRLPLLAAPLAARILVADNEAKALEALCAALTDAGYRADQARTGAEALERLAATTFSLLVLDVDVPDGDGWKVLTQVRETERTRSLPVLVLTGLGSVSPDQALALGADEFLAKPVSARVLVETVARLLARPGATGAAVEEKA